MKKAICILGSARSNGNTRGVINEIDPSGQYLLEDLNELDISMYDYNHKNQNDDFLKLMDRILQHEVIILATPVYWYSMSAQMKMFFDRITDCVTIRKDMGRALEGKKVFLLVSYTHDDYGDFEYPFKETCKYFKMEYKGAFFHCSKDSPEAKAKNEKISEFAKKIEEEVGIGA